MCEVGGWIKIHRKMLNWEWYDDINIKTVFIHCLLKANYEDKSWKGIIIKRGSFVTSIDKLANETKLTIKKTKTALEKLILTQEMGKQTTNKYTILTVNNYETYQVVQSDEGQTKGKQKANEGQTKGKQMATTKEYKEIEEIKNEENIPEIKISGDKKPNFIQTLYKIFTELYLNSRGYDFETDTIKKEESAIGKLAQGYKQRNPGKTTEDAIVFFTDFFKKCLQIEHEFLKRSMSPSLILNQKSQINTIIKEGDYANTTNIGNNQTNQYRNLPGGRVTASFSPEDYKGGWDG